jgi:transcriptional regulator with GAF, ATPase, and Fis domain
MDTGRASSEPATDATATAVFAVLSEIARISSETIELPLVFARVTASLRKLIPFGHAAVVRIIDGDRAVLYAGGKVGYDSVSEGPQRPLSDWSPRWRPRVGPVPRVDDAERELDPSFAMDRKVLGEGLKSALWEPFQAGNSFAGGVSLCGLEPHAFTDEHQSALRPIASLLGSAVEHWHLWEGERRRRERLDEVESLLATLAESLDVREVFTRLSAALQGILPHHLMNLTELDLRARTIRIAASAGEIPVRTETFTLNEREVEDRTSFAIVDDVAAELAGNNERYRLIRRSGMRSWLHVPVWLSGEVRGSLSFLHREPSRYRRDDAEVALRVAARVALTLSHQRLAEEARLAAESRERAERLEATVQTLVRELELRGGGPVVGVSRSWKASLEQVARVAPADTTVLITGESGTGKEVIANLIHRGSPRAGRPFVAINCAALPEELLESELFGHERGAFTGAIATKIGRIEQAQGGTLFLDEIGEMSPFLQAKFLRVLEGREFQRVGGTRTLKTDARVVAATNRDLAAAIARETFREDLFYRLNVFQIHIAPLRERREDILPLADTFLGELGGTMGRPAAGFARDARERLLAYPWPGNVRELRNAIERAILLCDGGLITSGHLAAPMARREPPPGSVDLESVERGLIEKALSQSRGNKSQAARLLGLTRAQLYSRLDKHGIR